ncbi:flagellar assembly peptidoglycan hydrolase FlgJ [Vibrio vulnificus]|uniref:flagellar assembly peptidoglycan hydrolase FlgJ n=1 Tax=Vibrio vulnificus TaxID=672 RepID=UPI001A317754|nr:flagellar assembly peptidoglycan hydrolase FlgJ [Vibrio vulnificus]EHD0103466.1 flagellar assembly peptidoglycan hydrolase FlgJ [Vibrio vulnificus]EIT6975189.1 flagellar assembly peptidoglycan hydrolase FlgJ [Vibrio vulnificus]EJB0232835.1 flagellar assembly peptidoglycan hydrolase FlgJ [Vibrio vulnificus]EJO3993736.1 flagellar assembly peptidoglycan hydrolase FlgJ [Vibrio vulnificus]
MINNPNDIGFIHDISNLDKLRQQAVNDKDGGEQKALEAAAKQFESIFTSMLFKSMREANSGFESDLMNSQNQLFYRQMLDEQMASELSSSGSLGLADMIVAQLSSGKGIDQKELAMREAGQEAPQRMPINRSKARETEQRLIESGQLARSDNARFDSPESFITSMRPYAERAAKSLGIEPSLLLAQAALETGWGQKVVKNARGSSNNLFNIKADRSWAGDKVTTQTLEFHDNTPVKETAAFRSYDSFADSFNDYVAFLNNNPRYQTALQHNGDSESFIRGIHRAGYATDPEYADKVLKVQQRIDNM